MLAVIGTVPQTDFPLTVGEAALDGDRIVIDGRSVDVNRGTPALIAAAAKTAEYLGAPPPVGYLAGDIGRGDGSRLVYEYLCSNLKRSDIDTIVFHYIQPEVDWHNRVLFAVEDMASRPMLIADAGFMYAAKMSGQAPVYDLFTPDAGELAFLADEEAPHPFYTRGFILHEENRAPELIRRAYEHDNAARFLLVKGREDVAADRTGILATVSTHGEEAMEAIGGTGDTLTGIVSALADSGLAVKESMVAAAKANRLAGYLAKPTPATRVTEIIEEIPQALVEVLGKA